MVFSKEELYDFGSQRTFTGEADEAAFLLGGIGAGNVSLGSRGELRDWEIFNKPGKGSKLANTYFAIWAKPEGRDPVVKVLESKLNPPHALSHGYHPNTGAGLPRMDKSVLRGEYPIAWIDFEDADLPVHVSLEAYTPLIPLNEEDSGIPGAIFTYRVTNRTDRPVDVTIAGSIINPIGGIEFDRFGNLNLSNAGQNVNDFRQEGSLSGLFLHSHKYAENDLSFGNVSLVTANANVTFKRAWLRGAWFDYLQEFWDDLSDDGRLQDLGYETPSEDHKTDTGTLGICERLSPGETKQIRFMLTWYFPNRVNGWNEHVRVKEPGREITQNYYVNRFDSSWAVAVYLENNLERLRAQTFGFHDALFEGTLPNYVIDALAGNMPVLRSTSCFWLKDGRFLGYEGCFDDAGCCDGTCTHVWNYAQTLAFLFPSLERNMRRTELLEEVNGDGKMNFRAFKMFDSEWMWHGKSAPAAADGQMGTVMRVYREWKLSGDDEFLKELWPNVKKTIKYAFINWDVDGDFVLDGEQHNTYDIEFYGPNPLTGIYLLGALRAGEEMALYLGETDTAGQYRDGFERSAKRLDELLWNGEYYVQRLDDVNQYKYQHGLGCLSDQLLGQQLAHLYGLGYLLPKERVAQAIRSVYKYNFKTDFTNHVNCQRTYVLNDEQGLLLCSWPNGGRPRLPFVYSDEVWTGIEYHVATHLIYEGFIEEGLTIVKAVRDRHDGIRRNPWNEVECGHHYARSMSSWGLLVALSGFEYDMARGTMKFDPVLSKDNFSTFWSTGKAWGTYSQKKNDDSGEVEAEVNVLYGDISGVTVYACGRELRL
ncbi:GH116 family glycosyl-hydrolase [Paenibacillus thermotolerans]|uniref:GH116 family glycosyl-hydrolase n=1 Tax=Paenibacillus thermotolerans TaxID=3027807 RepID=UPI002368D67C|nr:MULTISPECIES: GH116 family glycosyl-hydrolase [unclassified Paenibacillus]